MRSRGSIRLGLGIALAVTAFYLLVGSRERPWGDARIMYEVAESLVARGNVAVKTEWPPMSHRGADGRLYAHFAAGPSFASVPGVLLRHAVNYAEPRVAPLSLVVTSHLAPTLAAAFTCVIFFFLCRFLGAGPAAASVLTAVLAASTTLFVYARIPYSEALQALCFLGFLGQVVRIPDQPTRRRALLLGVWAGALVNAKVVLVLSVLGGGLVVLVALRRDRRALARVVAWGLAGALPWLALFAVYNHLRWGSPFLTGYEGSAPLWRERLWVGLAGQLVSPGKSVFLYSPPLVAAALVFRSFARQHRRTAWALAATVLPPLLFFSGYLSWSGDYCWGPRFLVFAVPAALLPLAPLVEDVLARRRRLLGATLLVLALAGTSVQVLGSAFYWDHWIRLSATARETWLGRPNRKGAAIPVTADGRCHACFEDMHGHQWLPPFQPIAGHLWMARHVPFRDDWATAQADAPWRRYTSRDLAAGDSYRAARVDWWGHVWLKDHPKTWRSGLILLCGLAGVLLAGVILWASGVVAARRASAGAAHP